MCFTAAISPTAWRRSLDAPRIRLDSFSIIFTFIPGGSVQHRLSAVHEHHG